MCQCSWGLCCRGAAVRCGGDGCRGDVIRCGRRVRARRIGPEVLVVRLFDVAAGVVEERLVFVVVFALSELVLSVCGYIFVYDWCRS